MCIAAGADGASNNALTALGPDGNITDRVVGFAGSYPNSAAAFAPVVQVRRDDRYRILGGYSEGGQNVVWRCAYYITKDTPKAPSGDPSAASTPFNGMTLAAPAGSPDGPGHHDPDTNAFDQLMDNNINVDFQVPETEESWGGYCFGNTTNGMADDPDVAQQPVVQVQEAPEGQDPSQAPDPSQGQDPSGAQDPSAATQ